MVTKLILSSSIATIFAGQAFAAQSVLSSRNATAIGDSAIAIGGGV